MQIEIYYVPCPKDGTAQKLITALLEMKLIACGNVINSQSLYVWENEAVSDDEDVAVMKTLPERHTAIEEALKKLHPYKIPALIRWTAKCNSAYFDWIKCQVSG